MSKAKIVSHSGCISYELHTLGWKAFQDLCATILSEVLGQTFQTFSPGNDGGRDGAFRGSWKRGDHEALDGSFTAQCKFTNHQGRTINLSMLEEEIGNARQLSQAGLADNYILMTNYKVTGATEKQFQQVFKSAGVRTFLVLGGEKISQFITESPRLRRLVPRLYGLGDLSEILDERAYAQAEQLLVSLQDDLSKFVPTAAYRKSAKALLHHGFVLLLGEPASGKSTIAATLALSSTDEWQCSCLKVENAADFKRHWNPHDPRQYFWVDDAFGTTQYQPHLVHDWNRSFPELHAAIKKGARVVFTSRDYIYQRANDDLKESTFPLLFESQVVINIQDLTVSEKEEILYNHIKRGDQPKEFRRAIKVFLEDVAASERFQPEIARRLGTKAFTKNLHLTKDGIRSFVEKPEEFLLSVLRGLGPEEKSALALIFMHGGALKSPITFTNVEQEVIMRMGGTQRGVVAAITAIKDSLVKREQSQAGPVWVLKHPTIRDAFASLVAEDDELLDIYIYGTPTDKLVNEVVCGDIKLEGVKVVIPTSRYPTIIGRLDNLPKHWESNSLVYTFLAYRCSRDFLQKYTDSHKDVLEHISRPISYLSVVSQVDLLKRLFNEKLLPSKYRLIFVATVKELAVETPDAAFLTVKSIRSILTQEEINGVLKAVKENLIPNLDETIDTWQSNYPRNEDPEAYFSDLIDALTAYQKEFLNDQTTVSLIEEAERKIESIVDALQSEFEAPNKMYNDEELNSGRHKHESGSRSIFDDIDA